MKTLDEIINNENYNRLNGALVERSIELAEKIRKAMLTAEITKVGDYSIRTVRSNGYSNKALYIETTQWWDYDCHPEYRSLEQTTNSYFCNDFNCPIKAARGRDRLKFLNDAKSILQKIDNFKQQRIANVENALKAVEGL